MSDGADVDVVVIGAGIAGASAAAALAPHARVALVEAEAQPAMHATGRSAALLNETVGDPVMCALAAESRPFYEEPPAGFSDHSLLAPRGLLWVAGAADAGELARLAAVAPDRTQLLDTAEARALVPTLHDDCTAAGALFEPDARTIDVASVMSGYLRIVRGSGSVVSTSWEALSIAPRGHGWVVRSGGRELRARWVVDAAGAWGDAVAGRAGVAPLGLATLRRTAALAIAPEHVAGWPMVMDVGGRWYAAPEPGGLLICPGDESPTSPADVGPEEIDVALAIERVDEALGLGLRSIRRAWAGLRTFCTDRRPAVGADPDHPGFVWLVGQGGGGIKTAPALAAIVAGVVLDGRVPPAAIDVGRFREPAG